ncbi:Beta-1,4-mannosyl-glycoprotein 4-beta-N-acetylglucosaminyltransferase [Purpureocillium takamizusanense]|uniref:Beta-1,4-mannosyl-glycoprotein 4-beta-N-acetylglucosaminyltransferase n=1 Tax=Purpureocillium takamizusanense TaxID=2060973 RepID=A0A9Q8QMC3_9HYPO|nr:Beta-1,4-mannosyl-glycoprotein 4-beta-N-acetylglucosaminyltransferase [Purpureocillium takamizusanense]UNI21852.1 Beta-1,4-mannosyl-glycoprotein 4-beta-N-acetylglucosaminyltransferase [Purpureocillium takamizusanense]
MACKSRARLILGVGVFSLIWWVFFLPVPHSGGFHEITSAPLPPLDFLKATTDRDQRHAEYYTSKVAREFCAAHGFSVFKPRRVSGERKVYDLVMVNSELDFLEIRLNTIYDHVDYFIIVESPKTFQGEDKPLIIKENWGKFRRYHDKMIYHELQFPTTFNPHRAWDYEDLQRDAMYEQVMLGLKGQRFPVQGDVIVVADVDEIPRPQALLVLRSCNYHRRLTLASKFYYYSFQFLHTGPEWQHPQATYYEGSRTLKPTNLRNGDGGFAPFRGREKGVLNNAGWHCSSCFATIEQFLNKMASFSHGWMNAEPYRDKDRIAAAVREGRDVWERQQDTFTRLDENKDMPPLVLEEPKRFGYMTNRDGPSAGFTDYLQPDK